MASDATKCAVHPELRALLDRHRAEAPTHKRSVSDQLLPIVRAVNASLAYLGELAAALQEAEMAAHDGGLDHAMGWLHDEIAAVKHRGEVAQHALRDYAGTFTRFERALTRPEAAILRDMGIVEEAASAADPAAPIDPAAQGPNKLELRAIARSAETGG